MPSSYSTDLKLELMVTGENSGTWGDKTNTNLNLVQQAIAGYEAISIAGGAQTTALVMTDATLSNARNAVIKLTGTITGNQIVTIPDGIEKTYVVENATSGAFTVTVKTTSGTGVTWATTDKGKKMVYSDGTNIVDTAFTEVVSDVSPSLGGDLDLNSNNITGTGNINISGFFRSSDGSASSPSIQPGVDANTGFFRPASDTIGFTTVGTERMRIDSSGNVGIGTTSPLSKLDVLGPSSVTSFTGTSHLGLTVRGSSAATDYSGIDFIGNNQVNPIARVGVLTTGSGSSLSFGTSNSYGSGVTNTAMTIDLSGNVGIGTTSPAVKLDVNGTINGTFIESSGNIFATSGIFRSSDGSAASPSIQPGVDADTGFFRPASNTIGFSTGGTERMRIDSSGDVGIGTVTPSFELDVQGSDASTDIRLKNNGTGVSRLRLISGGTSSSSLIEFGDDSDVNVGSILYFHGDNYMNFVTNADSHMRLNSTGDLTIGDTLTEVQPGLGNNTQAISLRGGTTEQFFISSAASPMFVNRTSDGGLIQFYSAGNLEGSINVSGSTVTYNGFTGTHWSRFTDNSKPTILKGTVLETLDEMCDWYNLEFTKTNEEGNTSTQRVPHILQDGQSVGDTVAHTYEGTDYQATIVKETDIKHMKSKVSDTVDAKNVYGVFIDYDNDGDGYNDFYVASVGSYVVRIKANETIAKGDLLQSNGDGTAKVQSDDNIKSSSFAKVLSTTVIETYEDGSFIVPCSLMC